MDAHAEQIGCALRLEARRVARHQWDRLRRRFTHWFGRSFSWLA